MACHLIDQEARSASAGRCLVTIWFWFLALLVIALCMGCQSPHGTDTAAMTAAEARIRSRSVSIGKQVVKLEKTQRTLSRSNGKSLLITDRVDSLINRALEILHGK